MASHLDNRRPHSGAVRHGLWSLPLRVLVALAIALLTLPVLDSPASADGGATAPDTTVAADQAAGTAPAASTATDATPAADPASDPTTATPAADPASGPTTGTADPSAPASASSQSGTGSTTSTQGGTQPKTTSRSTTTSPLSMTTLLAPVLAALAAPVTSTGGFEIDGDTAQNNGGDDWANKGTVRDDTFDDATQFTSGSKEYEHPSNWVTGSGTSPGKDDVGNVYSYNTTYGGDVWSFFGFVRDANTGTTLYDVEYNQLANTSANPPRPHRSPGDLMVQLTQNGNSDFSVHKVFLWTLQSDAGWHDGNKDADPCITVTGYTPAAGWCPTTVPGGAFTGAVSADGKFAEGALNISALFGSGTCRGDFGVINIRSRSSDSNTAAVKDWVAPIGVNIPGSCAKIVIQKQDLDGNPLAGATFKITPDPTPGVSGGSLTVQDNDATDKDPAAGVIKIDPVEPDSYTVEETGAPPGYFFPKDRSIGPRALDAGSSPATYTFTFKDPAKWADLTATKTATATYDAAYAWSLDKSVSSKEQHVPEGTSASFDYKVKVTEGARTTSNWKVTGKVSVTNPNHSAMVATLDDSVADGGSCTFAAADISGDPGTQVSVPAGSTDYGYTCSYATAPSSLSGGGTNTATVTWSRADYPKTQADVDDPASAGVGTATATKSYTWSVANEANKTVTVTDTQTTFDPAWTITWSAEGTVSERTYTKSFAGVPGECTSYPNTAKLFGDGDVKLAEDSESVKVCVGSDLSVTKNVVSSLTRTYDWGIAKKADKTELVVDPSTGEATANYTVTVTALPYSDSQWAMSGKISVTNPNKWEDVTLTDLTDVYDGGGTCSVSDFGDGKITADSTRDFHYTCLFGDTKPVYDGTNTATATWDESAYATPQGTADGTVDVVESQWDKTSIDQTITVKDDKTVDGAAHVLGTVDWSPGLVQDFTYSVDLAGVPGDCKTYTNNAWIDQLPEKTASSSVEVCWPLDVTVAKTAAGTYHRDYTWDLKKEVAETKVTISGGVATFHYTVTATPKSFVDSGWAMGGTITVSNPNLYKAVSVDLTDAPAVGGGATCAVTNGTGVVIPVAHENAVGELVLGTATRDYTCTVPSKPTSYTDGTNVATASYDGKAIDSPAVKVPFTLPEENKTNETVHVTDDKTTGTQVALGTATWNDAKTPATFSYTVDKAGVLGQCTTYDNTAEITETEQQAKASVELCVQTGLVVTKDAHTSFDRLYKWKVAKAVEDPASVEIAQGGDHTFHYTVTATPEGYVDSNWTLDGTITVENPNAAGLADITAAVTDVPSGVGGGVQCTVTGGDSVTLASGEQTTLPYACTFASRPAYTGGTNTAYATWQSPGGEASAQGSAAVTFTDPAETDKTVTVTDDKTTGTQGTLGTATWNGTEQGPGEPTVFYYDVTLSGEPGVCTDYPNTAKIEGAAGTLDEATKTVTVCSEKPLVVEKTADASFDRTYNWLIDKSVDQTRVEVDKNGQANFHYTVTATPNGYTDGNWKMSGDVTLTNPNTYEGGGIVATVTDVPHVGGGTSCLVTGGDQGTNVVTLAPGATKTLTYDCDVPTQPAYDGTNDATATWQGPAGERSVTGSTAVSFGQATWTDYEVQVTDDKVTHTDNPDVLGNAQWNGSQQGPGEPTSFEYDLTLPGTVGECTTYDNTAYLDEAPSGEAATSAEGQWGSLGQAQASVDVCRQGDLTIVNAAEASYDTSYDWTITKDSAKTRYDVPGDHATVDYTVTATPGAATDSAWTMTGALTVANPNGYKDVTVSVAQTTDLGPNVSCALDPGQDMVVPKGGSTTLTYTCQFNGAPSAKSGKESATVTWDKGNVQLDSPVSFSVGKETNKVVDVVDDKTVPGNKKALGQATWNEAGTPTDFSYSLDLPAKPGCTDYDNTATIVQAELSADAPVTVCAPEVLPREQVRPRPPLVKGVELPATGAPADSGWLLTAGGLAVVLGAWLALRSRRRWS